MSTTLDTQTLYEALRKKLGLHWVSGKPHGKRIIHNSRDSTADLSLVGHLNLINPHCIQVLGKTSTLDPGEPAAPFALESWTHNRDQDTFEHQTFDLEAQTGRIVFFQIFGSG